MIIRIESVRIQNYRCVRDATIIFDNITALIGSNGSGKSCFLKALNAFFTNNYPFSQDDFFANDVTSPIKITITFSDLDALAREEFSAYINDDKLAVTKIMKVTPGQKNDSEYHGTRKSNPDFSFVRAGENATDVKNRYIELIKQDEYNNLPSLLEGRVSEASIIRALLKWEDENPSKLVFIEDDGQFFGYKQVGEWRLSKYCDFIYIRATNEVEQYAMDQKKTPIAELINITIRNTLSENSELNQLIKRTEQEYARIIGDAGKYELIELKASLSRIFSELAPGNSLDILWDTTDGVVIENPRAKIRIIERGFSTELEGAGDGSKRALIMALLQHLAFIKQKNGTNSDAEEDVENQDDCTSNLNRCLIIGIEEPELFQHPGRQRTIAKVLNRLAYGENNGFFKTIQVVFSTHSPILIDIDKFEQIRIIKKGKKDAQFDETSVISTSFIDVQTKLIALDKKLDPQMGERNQSAEDQKSHLTEFISPEINEGFFSDVVVLVEGLEDKAALNSASKLMNIDFDQHNITIIPCCGKQSLPKAYTVFSSFGIPIYIIWDSDKSGNNSAKINKKLLHMVNSKTITDYPFGVENEYACFEESMTKYLENSIAKYGTLLDEIVQVYGITKREPKKNPLVIQYLFDKAYPDGLSSENKLPTDLRNIIEKIIQLNNRK